MIEISDTEFAVLKEHLSKVSGIEVPPEKRYLFKTRLSELLEAEHCPNFSVFYTRLTTENDGILERELVMAMTTHETDFFRDRHPFECLQRKLLPAIVRLRLASAGPRPVRIRILSCGCSSGQEPYSLAICVREWLGTQSRLKSDDFTVLGVDISRRILDRALRGVYTATELGESMPEYIKSRYFVSRNELWEISGEVRKMVNFAEVNLAESLGFMGQFDLIFCRNVIIYLTYELKKKIIQQFRSMLNAGGALFLGASESLYPLTDEFVAVHDGPTMYYQPR
jgi:chemotaxis protein methyltransferase CheR